MCRHFKVLSCLVLNSLALLGFCEILLCFCFCTTEMAHTGQHLFMVRECYGCFYGLFVVVGITLCYTFNYQTLKGIWPIMGSGFVTAQPLRSEDFSFELFVTL